MNKAAENNDLEPLPTTSESLLKTLETLDIAYKNHHHAPIFTVEEGLHLKAEIPGLHCRNLFLRDKKKKMFLITAANETEIDLKKLENLLDSARLSFGSPERLWTHLGIRPGSVNPFCVINDTEHQVSVIIDQVMMEADAVNVHPMDNAMTVSIAPKDLMRFFAHTGHDAKIVDLTDAAPDPT